MTAPCEYASGLHSLLCVYTAASLAMSVRKSSVQAAPGGGPGGGWRALYVWIHGNGRFERNLRGRSAIAVADRREGMVE